MLTQHFGRLVVIADAPSKNWRRRVLCRCACGTEKVIGASALRRGQTKSCGCWRVDDAAQRFTTHGAKRSAEYRAWSRMKDRCYNPKNPFYARYGGRGISVHPAWVHDFTAFLRDVGFRPSTDHSLDRYPDPNGDYKPGNTRWATKVEQATNRATVRVIEHNGIRDSIAGWARRHGIPYSRLRRRLVDGWPVARALEAKDCAVRALLYKG